MMVTNVSDRLKTWLSAERLREHEDKVLLAATLVIGALVGLVIVAFIVVTENLGARMYPAGGAAWRRFVIPVAGSLISGILLFRYFPNARGSGIPQTKTALFIYEGQIRFRTVLGKFLCSSISLASGIALGREGPSVQVGAGIASSLGRRLGLSPSRVKALVPAGCAAALAAAFNTPIAAVLFTLEEVLVNFHAPVLGSIVVSSAASWVVLRLMLGDEPLFHVPAYELVHPLEFLFYAGLGIVGGLVSVAFVKLLLRLRRRFLKMPRRTVWVQPVAGGLFVGFLGIFIPQILGVGYGHVGDALNGKMALQIMALLVVLKVSATAVAYASGNAGGIFGPSLFMGAMMGGAFGSVIHGILPDYTGSVGAYALVGMGTVFAGVLRVPLTAIIMIFEITRDYSIIVPLMISNLVASFVSYKLQREPIYEALLHQEGTYLPEGPGSREAMLVVRQAMRPAAGVLHAGAKLGDVGLPSSDVPVVDDTGLAGVLSLSDLEQARRDKDRETRVGDLFPAVRAGRQPSLRNLPHVHADQPLDTALKRMAQTKLKVLPVVSRTNIREMIGVVSLDDVMSAYGLGGERNVAAAPDPAESKDPGAVLAGVLATVLGVIALFGFLTYYYRSQRAGRALESYRAGNELMEQGRTAEAIENYRHALSTSHNPEHRRALAMALVEAGRLNEAQVYLTELLDANPSSGIANLGMARAAAGLGNLQEAVRYYRRAIYGIWTDQPEDRRVQARFELARLLRNTGSAKQAVSELLALTEESPADAAIRRRVARALLDLGAAEEAAGVYAELLRRAPKDVEALEGLGDAEYVRGRFAAARQAFQGALRLNPENEIVRKNLVAAETILALDPALRGLSSAERYQRSRRVLEALLGSFEQCKAAKPESLQKNIEAARAAAARRRRPASYSDATDTNISLALELWEARSTVCSPPGGGEEVLSRIMLRLSP